MSVHCISNHPVPICLFTVSVITQFHYVCINIHTKLTLPLRLQTFHMLCLKQKYFGAYRTHMFHFVLNSAPAGYTCNAYMRRRIYSNLTALVHNNMQVTATCFG
jgi:hypothetical protein